jgi:hypothetical protein
VGGVGGYAEFLRALADAGHPEHATYRRWIGGSFDSEAFALQVVNERLRSGARRRKAPQWDFAPDATFEPAVGSAPVSAEHEATAQGLPLRRDVMTLLAYLREHKVTGTQSTGNLPLKAVADIAAGFVVPPVLQHDIAGRSYPFRSEEDVGPVFFVHLLARGADLVEGGPALQWRLTPRAEAFFSAAAAAQVLLLFSAWWRRVDWSLLVPFSVFGDDLSLLKTMPSGQWAEFEPFVERLFAEAHWTWSAPPTINGRDHLAWSVERTAIRPLEQFGVLSTRAARNEDETAGLFSRPKPVAISLTAFGRLLLDRCFQ